MKKAEMRRDARKGGRRQAAGGRREADEGLGFRV